MGLWRGGGQIISTVKEIPHRWIVPDSTGLGIRPKLVVETSTKQWVGKIYHKKIGGENYVRKIKKDIMVV